MSSTNNKFLSKIGAYVVPIGSHNDPKDKEGLMSLLAKQYKFSTKRYPDASKLFYELESKGAIFESFSDREKLVLWLSAPADKYDESKLLLDELFDNVLPTVESFDKAKQNQIMELAELSSNSASFAISTFVNSSMSERALLGTSQEQLNSIQFPHLETLLNSVKAVKPMYISMDSSQDREIVNPIRLDGESKDDSDAKPFFTVIDKDIEQKVFCYGFKTEGFEKYDYATRRVAISLLNSGLTGLVFERIREQNSAAYYASVGIDLMVNKGSLFIYAGVSEKNIPLVINLSDEIWSDVSTGNFEDERVENAKEYFKGRICRIYDSLSSILVTEAQFRLYGRELPSYEQLISEVSNVTKEGIVNFFKSITVNNHPSLLINGKISTDIKDKCDKIFYDKQ